MGAVFHGRTCMYYSWSGKIWNVFDLLNLSDTFLNGTEVNILQAKRKLNMIMHQTWCEKLPFKPKLRTYMLIKIVLNLSLLLQVF